MSKTRFNLTEKGTERRGGAGLAASPKQLGAQTTTNEQTNEQTNIKTQKNWRNSLGKDAHR